MKQTTRLTWMLLALALPGLAAAAEIPHYADETHLGVATCASGVCHGSVQARTATPVNQNEYVIWSRRDRHRIAYNTLLTDESKRIARNLGLPNAHEADMCLDCHADNVPVAKRSDKFLIEDGVGCEACHGGAETWISSHVDPDTPRIDNLDAGLYPTDEPRARAKLCLSCHLGNGQKMATHDIMGAGHPRISFELDTFSWLQPAHYVLDADYGEEKWAGSSVTVWTVGQIEAARQTLALIDERLKTKGVFPELALFDCHACHHPMSDKRWTPKGYANLPPGSVRLNDANFVMLFAIARVLAPELAPELKQGLAGLHAGVMQGSPDNRIGVMHELLSRLDQQVDRVNPANHTMDLVREVVRESAGGRVTDYVSAEQALMAVDLLLSTADQRDQYSDWLDKAYLALGNEDSFNPVEFARIMKQYRG